MNKEKINKLMAALIILSIILVGFYFKKKKETILSSDFNSTEGIIVNASPVPGKILYYEVIFEYKVNDNILKGKVFVNSKFKCPDNPRDFCIGNTFIVKYSNKDSSISDIDLKTYNSLKL